MRLNPINQRTAPPADPPAPRPTKIPTLPVGESWDDDLDIDDLDQHPAPGRRSRPGFDPATCGWPLGTSKAPRGVELHVPWDRTTGVIGPQGSGKTLDVLVPALLAAPGPALTTLTKPEDMLLSWTQREQQGPCHVLDPFGITPGLPELVWDPIAGCIDPILAERRAKAFTAGTILSAQSGGATDTAAQFYAAEAAKVLQCFIHAAALSGATLDHVLEWVSQPRSATLPLAILQGHPHAAPQWDGLLTGSLHGDERTASNTIATVQQAMALFFQESIRRRCVPSPGHPATPIADILDQGGTIYMLGREDPYASASPLMTAVAEDVLDTGIRAAQRSPHGRLTPPLLACLDELPSTAPLPTLQVRMANERALGLSFIWATQTTRQLAPLFGDEGARALIGLTNVLTIFGGGKDHQFNQEISDLLGSVRVATKTYQSGRGGGSTTTGTDIPIMTPAEIRGLPQRQALIIAENAAPILAKLHRCIDGKNGRRLMDQQADMRHLVAEHATDDLDLDLRTAAAVAAARDLSLTPPTNDHGKYLP